MKIKIAIMLALSLLLLSTSSWADSEQNYFKFLIGSRAELDKLTNVISIDDVKGLTVYAYANSREFAAFRELGYRYEMLSAPGSLITPPMSSDPGDILADWDTYPTYQGYLDMMNLFAATYPNLCTIVNIGSTVQGRQLLFAKISDNVNTQENEPEVMYTSSIHGDETTGYVLMLRLIDYLLSNYGTDPQATALVNNLEIWINPLANPDGTYHGGNNSVSGAIRGNANGVDMNRNYPDPAAGQHPDGNTWQPETNAMMAFSGQHSLAISANFHGGAEVVNYPWDTWARLHPDDQWCINISRAYAESVQVYSNHNGYMTYLNDGITNGYAWYRVTGGRQDYMNYWRGCREVTIEISNTKLLPAAQLPTHWNYNRVAFLNWIENALYGVRGLVTDASSGLPLLATVTVVGREADSCRVFTDPDVGDYHRMLEPGTYSLRFVCPGYVAQTVNGVVVENRQTTTLDIQLQAVPNDPLLAYVGNDAGLIDPGETVAMHITLRNDGGGSALGVNGILSTLDPYISISEDSSAYPQISPLGGTAVSLSTYSFSVLPGCPPYHQAHFRLGLTAQGGYVDSAFFDITIGQDIEDFETGNFTTHEWQMSGNANWVISTTNPYEGEYSAKSGTITHLQSSALSLEVNVTAPGTISFRYKVSSEASYDYLKFYIDGNLQAQWAGEVAWDMAGYAVSAGVHTFKWEYYKDQSVSRGSDCAWIDYVVLPPSATALEIVTTSLPNWTAGHPYSRLLEATGGVGNKTWSDLNGNLPGTGLNLSLTGLLSGTPLAGLVSFIARVQDEAGGSAQRPFSFTINPALQVTTESLPDGVVGSPYSVQFHATGGTGSRSWIDRDNDLTGSGLTLSQTGLLSGTPVSPGTVSFTVVATDSIGAQGQRDLTLTVSGPSSYLPGDANNSGQTNGIDVVFMINYFKGGDIPPYTISCPPHGDIFPACDANGNCIVNGIDATYLVNFLKGGPAVLFCADCPPAPMQLLIRLTEKD